MALNRLIISHLGEGGRFRQTNMIDPHPPVLIFTGWKTKESSFFNAESFNLSNDTKSKFKVENIMKLRFFFFSPNFS